MGCCTSAPTIPNPDKIDLSHFQEYKVLGRGGFGTVLAVVQKDRITGEDITNKIYAMKRLSKEKIVSRQVNLDMLWRERDIMIAASELLHSHFLCHLFWAFQSDSEVFLVMEFMQGGDLRYQMRTKENLNKQRPLSEKVVRFYACEIILALCDLHSVNIVYRDLKPENALLDDRGHLRLSDFGISEKLSSRNNYQTKGRSGTVAYMSPEMLMRRKYGREVDWFALGVTLYELLHVDLPWRPYNGSGTSECVRSHFTELTFDPSLSPEIVGLISQLLATKLSDRLIDPNLIKAHPWFESVNWADMAALKVVPPITPEPDVANCTSAAQLEVIFIDEKPKSIPDEIQEVFGDFEYAHDAQKEEEIVMEESALGVPGTCNNNSTLQSIGSMASGYDDRYMNTNGTQSSSSHSKHSGTSGNNTKLSATNINDETEEYLAQNGYSRPVSPTESNVSVSDNTKPPALGLTTLQVTYSFNSEGTGMTPIQVSPVNVNDPILNIPPVFVKNDESTTLNIPPALNTLSQSKEHSANRGTLRRHNSSNVSNASPVASVVRDGDIELAVVSEGVAAAPVCSATPGGSKRVLGIKNRRFSSRESFMAPTLNDLLPLSLLKQLSNEESLPQEDSNGSLGTVHE